MSIITLTTDFGPDSRYVAQLKGVLLSKAPDATLVDLSHSIPPQDIASAARLLEQSALWYPKETVHLAVVDPGVGTDRAIVIVRHIDHCFIGPDNGLFGWLAKDAQEIVSLDPAHFDSSVASATFHGRDLMAPAAARLALGAKLLELGDPHKSLFKLPPLSAPRVSSGSIEGKIIEIDYYGNLISNIEQALLADSPQNEELCIECGEHETFGLQITYGDQPPHTLVALIGSQGYLELAIVNGNAAKMLGAVVGDPVNLLW